MKQINLGTIKMPATAATKAFAVLAKRGAGKSYTAAVMAEEFAKVNVPFVVFDPIDVWWGLRLAANGKDKGLPIVVFGLQNADIPLTRDMGKKIARAVVEENISCVISTFGMPKVAMRELIADFSEELLNINKTARHIFIEEAHEFVPQRVFGAGARCFAAVEALLVMGRNRGIGVTLINQRAATINKDLLTQVDTLVALRSVGPQDRKALSEWVEAHAADGDFNEFIKSLPSLPTGEAWIWSPEFMEVFKRVKIRKRETFHPDREKLGVNFKIPEIKQGDIKSFIEKFSVQKKVEMPKKFGEMKTKIVSERGLHQDDVQKLIEKGVSLERSISEKQRSDMIKEFERERESWRRLMDHFRKNILKAHEFLSTPARLEPDIYTAKFEKTGRLVAGAEKKIGDGGKIEEKSLINTRYFDGDSGVGGGGITGGAQRMLKALASYTEDGLTRAQLATIADVKLSGGSFTTYLSRLRQNQFIMGDDNKIYITKAGIEYIGEQKQITSEDVIDMWMKKMTGGARRMLEVIVKMYPERITRQDLAYESGVAMSGGSFTTYLSRLRGNGLIVVDSDGIQASDILFK